MLAMRGDFWCSGELDCVQNSHAEVRELTFERRAVARIIWLCTRASYFSILLKNRQKIK